MWEVLVLAAILGQCTCVPTTTKAMAKVASSTKACWPKENFAMMQPGSGCPGSNWLSGEVTDYLNRNSSLPEGDLVKGSVDGNYLRIYFCAHHKELEQNCTGAPAAFPAGAYCLYEYGKTPHTTLTRNCPAGFKWSWVSIDDVNRNNRNSHSGATPLGEFFTFSTVQYHCCRDDGDPTMEITLPTDKDFILLPTMTKSTCQQVKGMTSTKSEVFYDTEDLDAFSNGAPGAPDFPPPEYRIDFPLGFWGKGLHLSVCSYTKTSKAAVSAKTKAKVTVGSMANPTCWPAEDFAMFQPKRGCPKDNSWEQGFVQHWEGPNSKVPSFLNAVVKGQAMTLGFCNHIGAKQKAQKTCTAANTLSNFPIGSYCLLEGDIGEAGIFDKSCPKGFIYSWFVTDDVDLNNKADQNGTVPAGEFYDFGTVYYTCCRGDGSPAIPINLPTANDFVLMPSAMDPGVCQAVNGMTSTFGDLFFDTENLEANVIPAPINSSISIDFTIDNPLGNWGAGLHVKVCHYTKKT